MTVSAVLTDKAPDCVAHSTNFPEVKRQLRARRHAADLDGAMGDERRVGMSTPPPPVTGGLGDDRSCADVSMLPMDGTAV